ncbi:MAG: HAMP domain-containing sensor histidine kinase [Burkholderiales bacterium]
MPFSDPDVPLRMTRDEFASLVTHELRNPLNAMNGWLHLLASDPAPRGEASNRALAGLRRAFDQQLVLIDTLGRVLRLAGGDRDGPAEPVELGSVLDEVAGALRPAASDVRREVVVGRPREAWIAGDRTAAVGALRALGAHALRHGLPGAPLLLRLEAETDRPVLQVSIDEGDDGGLSIWHAFGSGHRLPLELLHAVLVLESMGARVAPTGDGRVGDTLSVRFDGGARWSAHAPPRA